MTFYIVLLKELNVFVREFLFTLLTYHNISIIQFSQFANCNQRVNQFNLLFINAFFQPKSMFLSVLFWLQGSSMSLKEWSINSRNFQHVTCYLHSKVIPTFYTHLKQNPSQKVVRNARFACYKKQIAKIYGSPNAQKTSKPRFTKSQT